MSQLYINYYKEFPAPKKRTREDFEEEYAVVTNFDEEDDSCCFGKFYESKESLIGPNCNTDTLVLYEDYCLSELAIWIAPRMSINHVHDWWAGTVYVMFDNAWFCANVYFFDQRNYTTGYSWFEKALRVRVKQHRKLNKAATRSLRLVHIAILIGIPKGKVKQQDRFVSPVLQALAIDKVVFNISEFL